MYNLAKRADEGRAIMEKNKARDLRVIDFMEVNSWDGDKFALAEQMFLIGVSIGRRIGRAEQRGTKES